MSSWFRNIGAKPAFGAHQSADGLATELEQQARQVGERAQSLADLLVRWVEQSDASGTDKFPIDSHQGSKEAPVLSLSFREGLLRSRAFEVLLDTCSQAPSLGGVVVTAALSAAQPPIGTQSVEETNLSNAMKSAVERWLLPGAFELWPSLLEALLAGNTIASGLLCPKKGALRWEHWARKVLAAIKRAWQVEALPHLLQQLNRRISELASKKPAAGSSTSSEFLLSRSGFANLSKKGIRAELAREQLLQRGSETSCLQARVELLCTACERLHAAENSCVTRVPRLERLLQDVDDALISLNERALELDSEQEVLSKTISDIGGELQRQITGVLMTQESFAEKRTTTLKERAQLMQRLKDLDAQLVQIDKSASNCEVQVRQLKEQLRGTTAHYEEKITATLCLQKGLSDEKLRAVTYKECASLALDVARCEAKRINDGLAAQSRRHLAELRRNFIAYLRQERSRLDAAAEWLDALQAGSGGMKEATVAVQGAWEGAQRLLHRVNSLSSDEANSAELEAKVLEEDAGDGVSASSKLEAPEQDKEDTREFFLREEVGMQHCVDCDSSGAEWASVSHGTYLCTDCAGRHRGLGVHVSFVQSTTMDRWTARRLRRMQLGGNKKFLDFLESFPQLRKQRGRLTSLETLKAFYRSRAVAFYRRRLDSLCEGRELATPPVSANEGHLLEDDTLLAKDEKASSATSIDADSGESGASDAELEEELRLLETSYRHCQQLIGRDVPTVTG